MFQLLVGKRVGRARPAPKLPQRQIVTLAFFLPTLGIPQLINVQTPAVAQERRPNIIFIMADDLGQYDLGCYGQRHILTPHLDRMAAEGCRFTQCYAGSAVCAPCRSVLMTGLHSGHTRVRGNSSRVGGVPPQGRVPLLDSDVTVAEVLKQAGYATGMTGKWGLGEPGTSGAPNNQGFDQWFGFLNQRHAHTYYPEYLWRNERFEVVWGNMGGYEGQWVHDLFTEFALDFVRQHQDQPFFLYLPYTVPHGRYEVPDEKPYADKPWPQSARGYAAMVTRMDRDIGRLFELLVTLGIDEQTIVFFCSDNGATYTDPPISSAGPLRGKKGDLYEGGIRTPMIVRWPGRIQPGRVSDHVWALWDVLPTAAELAGVDPPANVDGISILPTLLGEAQQSHEFLYWEFPTGKYWQAVRYGDWKGVRTRWQGPLELYNLAEDLGEQRNVARENPRIVARIEAMMRQAHVESVEWPTPQP